MRNFQVSLDELQLFEESRQKSFERFHYLKKGLETECMEGK